MQGKLFSRLNLYVSLLLFIFLSSCGQKYTYTPLYPTPPNGYYQGVSFGTVYNGNLIVAGQFNSLFNNSVGIAQWNGSTWQGLGSGVGASYSYSNIASITSYSGNLVVGGNFNTAGGQYVNSIAQWNGSTWQPLTSGVYYSNASNSVPTVTTLTVYNGNLIAGGSFQYAGGVLANNIASWNGSAWQSMGGGSSSSTYYYSSANINALAVYNGNLIAGGGFDTIGGQRLLNIAQWNGTTWSSVGGNANARVNTLTIYNGNLIAIGNFDTIGGIVAKMGVAQWNGTTWSAINMNISFPVVYNNSLYFRNVNDSTVCAWNGSGAPVVIGIAATNKERWHEMAHTYAHPLCVYNGNLIVGGWFTSINGVNTSTNLAQWNGSNWSSF